MNASRSRVAESVGSGGPARSAAARSGAPRPVTSRPGATGRVDPRAVVIWSSCAIGVTLVSANPVYRGLVALAAIAVLQAWRLPGRRLRPLAFAALAAASIAGLVNVLASHTGAHEILRFPDSLPVIGGPVTVESLAFGGTVGLGLVAALVAVAPLSLALETHDLVAVIPRPFERTGVAVAASLNLVSGIGRTFGAVRDAQRMRGWRPRGLRSWNHVVVPVVLTAIEDSVLLAESMEARGFGAPGRTSYAALAWSRRDAAIVLVAAAVLVAFVAMKLAGADTDWYPYPTLEAPAVQPLLALGCAALALPAVLSDGRE